MTLMRRTLDVRSKSRLWTLVMRTRLRRSRCSMRPGLRLTVLVGWPLTPSIFTAATPLLASAPALRRSARRKASTFNQRVDRRRFKLEPFAPFDRGRHCDNAIACADQSADHDAQRFEYPPHFAVAAFPQHDAIPVIGRILVAATIFNRLAARDAVVERNAREQLLLLLFGQATHDANRVFAVDLITRVHQPIGKLTGIGEQQQTFSVVIEAPDIDPFAVADRRQLLEHGRTSFGIVARHNFARRLVIDEHPRARLREANLDKLAVDTDFIAGAHLLTDFRGHAVHGNASSENHLLHRAPRPEPARRQHLVQALRFVEDFVSGALVLRRRQALRDPLQRQARLLHWTRGPDSRARVAPRWPLWGH